MKTHEDFTLKHEIRTSSDRSFGFVFCVFFVIVALLPLRSGGQVRLWAVASAMLFLLVALVRPTLLRPLNRIWTQLGLLLGRIVNPIVTGLLFAVAFTPIGVIRRMLTKDPLHLRYDTSAETYWIPRSTESMPESMLRQF